MGISVAVGSTNTIYGLQNPLWVRDRGHRQYLKFNKISEKSDLIIEGKYKLQKGIRPIDFGCIRDQKFWNNGALALFV